MKTTIEIDDALYSQLKAEASRSGRTVRDLVAEGVTYILRRRQTSKAAGTGDDFSWFGALRKYAANARGGHGLAAIRRSIAKRR